MLPVVVAARAAWTVDPPAGLRFARAHTRGGGERVGLGRDQDRHRRRGGRGRLGSAERSGPSESSLPLCVQLAGDVGEGRGGCGPAGDGEREGECEAFHGGSSQGQYGARACACQGKKRRRERNSLTPTLRPLSARMAWVDFLCLSPYLV